MVPTNMVKDYSSSIYSDSRVDNLQAEWSVRTTLWEAQGWDTLWSGAFYWYLDLVGCVLVPVAVGRGSL